LGTSGQQLGTKATGWTSERNVAPSSSSRSRTRRRSRSRHLFPTSWNPNRRDGLRTRNRWDQSGSAPTRRPKHVSAVLVTIPDSIEPIVAYRAWTCHVEGIEPTLLSLGGDGGDVWNEASENWIVASCAAFRWRLETVRAAFEHRGLSAPSLVEEEHAAPAEGCSCGFYALKSATDAFERFGRSRGNLIGRVKLAGKVIEHDPRLQGRAGSDRRADPGAGDRVAHCPGLPPTRDRDRSFQSVGRVHGRPRLRLSRRASPGQGATRSYVGRWER
jgi:hypothetical protein